MSEYPQQPAGATPAQGNPPAQQQAKEVAQQGKQVAQQGKQAAAEVASTATDGAKDVAQQTAAQARDLMGKTRTQLREQVEVQQQAAVETLRSLGDQLAEMTDHVNERGTAIDLATQARDRARSAADWLDGREPDDLLDELRKAGRNRPGAFLLTAALAGVLAGRLTRGVVAEHTDDTGPAGLTGNDGSGAHRAGLATDDRTNRPAPGSVEPVVPR